MDRVTLFDVVRAQREPVALIELARRDNGATLTLDAATLIAQYTLSSSDVLLVLDEDTLFEEQLHLVLVRGVAVEDHLLIGAPYASGIFHEVDHGEDTLRFRFAGDDVLTLVVDPAASRLPQRLPSGVRRRGGWFAPHRLSLSIGQS